MGNKMQGTPIDLAAIGGDPKDTSDTLAVGGTPSEDSQSPRANRDSTEELVVGPSQGRLGMK